MDNFVVAPSFDGTQPCAQTDPEIFFPHPSDRQGIANAKAICNTCPFVEACLKYAVNEPSLQGIWGATTQRQRETIRTRLRKMQSVSN